MHRLVPAIFVIALVICSPVHAMFSVDETVAGRAGEPFSAAFLKAYEEAGFGSGPPGEADRFEKLLAKFRLPQEQAELQITLGVIYNQRTGLVDHRKSIDHMTRALNFALPPIVLIRVCLWRGNSLETTGRQLDALQDYVRGLRICLGYDLPEKTPERPVFKKLPYIGESSTPENDALIREINKKTGEYRFQEEMIRQRYYLVDAIKRVLADRKIPPERFETLVANTVKDERMTRWILKRVSSTNERPWK